eukprot:scaffold23712_cov32-Tisochrysis_lutea.AAC.1
MHEQVQRAAILRSHGSNPSQCISAPSCRGHALGLRRPQASQAGSRTLRAIHSLCVCASCTGSQKSWLTRMCQVDRSKSGSRSKCANGYA